jgi:hypothetical protein
VQSVLLPILALLAPATIDNRSDKVIDLFIQVCMRGEARFKKGDVKKVASNALPWHMHAFNTQGQFYKVRVPVEAWLVVRDARSDHDPVARTCRVGARYVDIRSAADQVRAYLRLPPLPTSTTLAVYEEDYLSGGARVEVRRTGWFDFVTLTSYVMTPEAADRARRKAVK